MVPRRERTTLASSTAEEEPCEALRWWFRGLTPLERLQALAIQDVGWVKMYVVLARKKPMQGVAEKEFEKEHVKAIFHMLQKLSDKGNHSLDSALLSPSSSDASSEAVGLQSSSRIISAHPSTVLYELEGSIRLLCGSLRPSNSKLDSSNQCEGDSEEIDGGECNHLDPTVEAGNKLQETIRLCSIRSTISEGTSYLLDTVVVLQEMLNNANSFLSLMSRASRSGFLSADPGLALKKIILENDDNVNSGGGQLLELPWLQHRTCSTISVTDLLVNRLEIALWTSYWYVMRQHEEQWQQQEISLCPSSVMSLSSSSSIVEERGNGSSVSDAKGNNLVDIAKEVITDSSPQPQLPEIQPSNFPSALATTTAEATANILKVLQTSTTLVQFWSSKSTKERLELMKGFGQAIDEVNEEVGTKRNGRTVEKLLFSPLKWVIEDYGQRVRVVVERIQAALSADCIMEELLALEIGEHVYGGGDSSSRENSSINSDQHRGVHNLKNRSKKSKRKNKLKNRTPKGLQQPQKHHQQQSAPYSTIPPMPLSSGTVVGYDVEDSPTIPTLPQPAGESEEHNDPNVVGKNGDVVASALLATPAVALMGNATVTVDKQDTIDKVPMTTCETSHPSAVLNDDGAPGLQTTTTSPQDDDLPNHVDCGTTNSENGLDVRNGDTPPLDTLGDCGWKEVVSRSRRKKEKARVQNERHHQKDLGNDGGRRRSSRQHAKTISSGTCEGNTNRGGMNTGMKLRHTSSNSGAMMLPVLNSNQGGPVTTPATLDRGMTGQPRKSKYYSLQSSLDSADPLSSQSFVEALSHCSGGASSYRIEPVGGDSPSSIVSTSVAQDGTLVIETGSAASTDPTQPPSPSSASSVTSAAILGKSEHPPPSHSNTVTTNQFCGSDKWDKISSLNFADIVKAGSKDDGAPQYSNNRNKEGEEVQPTLKMEASSLAEEARRKRIVVDHPVTLGDGQLSHPPVSDCMFSGGTRQGEDKSRNDGAVTRESQQHSSSLTAAKPLDPSKRTANETIDHPVVYSKQPHDNKRLGHDSSSAAVEAESEQASSGKTAAFSATIENLESVLDAVGDPKKGLRQSSIALNNHNNQPSNDVHYHGHERDRDVGSTVPEQQKRPNQESHQGGQNSRTCKMQVKKKLLGHKGETGKPSNANTFGSRHLQHQQPSVTKSSSVVEGEEGFMTDNNTIITTTMTKKQQNARNNRNNTMSLMNMQGIGGRVPQTVAVAHSSAWLWIGNGIVPWTVYPDYRFYDESVLVKHLDANIEAFMGKLLSVTCPRRHAWQRIVKNLTEIVISTWKEARVEVYGSCYTGLELPSSDLDVVICGIGGKEYEYGKTPKDPHNSEETVGHLRQLATALQCEPWVHGMKVIETASIPVIKILADLRIMTGSGCNSNGDGKCTGNPMGGGGGGGDDDGDDTEAYISQRSSSSARASVTTNPPSGPASTGGNWLPYSPCTGPSWQEAWPWASSTGTEYVPLDISFSSPMHGGIGTSKWVRDNVQEGKYRCCIPAILIIKEMLCQRGLNQPWSGGLSSYSQINMMVTVLQEIEKQHVRDRKLETLANSLKENNTDTTTSAYNGGGISSPAAVYTQRQQQHQQMTCENHSQRNQNGCSSVDEEGLIRVSLPVPIATGETCTNLDYVVGLTERELIEESLADVSPGLCLLRFLEFYGRAFNNRHYGISVGRGALRNPFLLEPSVADQQSGVCTSAAPGIVIEDPINMSINVAHSCFGFSQVQWLFSNCLNALELRGPEILRYDKNADLLQLLGYF